MMHGSIGALAAADVAYLSRSMVMDGAVSERDAEDLIAFDHLVVAQAPEWTAFFVAAIASHILADRAPADVVDGEKCDWLFDRLAPRGRADSPRLMPLLLRIMEGARSVVPRLPAFALMQLRAALITGEGAALAGRHHPSRMVDAHDVALIRRILVAGGGGEGRAISREEAEVLFGIHDATIGAENAAGFVPLFVGAITQHVRAASGQRVAPRGLSLQPGKPAGGPSAASVPLAPEVAGWLAQRILRDGRMTPAMVALRDGLLGPEAPIGESLRALLDRAA
ncbi:hypothetical protein [Ancylobacter lacus]|uniref:hypothetical protein n=1 Tax=Ancylobacter lacus TaxID=2579970 RepID=UPI001BCFA91E|nr:hypothetical protein [Ancylobacter lacus]MBS7540860.1 hypothetical protein [Ancylobacter lacus]